MNRHQNDNGEERKARHRNLKRILRVGGGVALAAGLAFVIVGFADFFRSTSNFGQPKLFWCFFAGIPLVFVGASLTAFGFHREIGRYVKNESVPIINEAATELAPAVKEIAKAVKEASSDTREARCSCGASNDSDANYCKTCGKPLTKTCPYCGEIVKSDNVFCGKCGKKLD